MTWGLCRNSVPQLPTKLQEVIANATQLLAFGDAGCLGSLGFEVC